MTCPCVSRVVGRTPGTVGSEAPGDPKRVVRAVLCPESGSVQRKRLEMGPVVLVPPVWDLVAVCAVLRGRVLATEVTPEWRLRSWSALAR